MFDVGKEKVSARFDAEGVRQIVLSGDNAKVYAVCGDFAGRLLEIDAKTGKVFRRFSAGHTPMAPVISPDGKTLFFCNRFSRHDQPDVHAFDIAAWKIKSSAKAIREPITMTLSKDGKFLWVVNHLPLIFDVPQQKYLATVLLDDTMRGAANPWGITVTDDDRWLCVNASGTHEVIFIDNDAALC